MRRSFATISEQPVRHRRRKGRRTEKFNSEHRQQQRQFVELRVSRSKTPPKDTEPDRCKSTGKPNLVSSREEIKAVLEKVRADKGGSAAKRRREVARVLGLEHTLFLPKEMLKTGKGENQTLYTNPYSGKIYGVSKVTTDCVGRYINTRNTDMCEGGLCYISKKIQCMQGLIHGLIKYRLPDKMLKLLRRVSVCFSAFGIHQFVNLVNRSLVQALLLDDKDAKLDTKLWRKSYPPRRTEKTPSSLKKGVVRNPRYGSIPIVIADYR